MTQSSGSNFTAQLLEPEVRELVHAGRYSEVRAVLHELPAADVADLLDELPHADAAVAFRFLSRDDAGEAFAELDHDKQETLIDELGTEGSLRVVEAMDPDDRAALIDELPSAVAQRLINSLSPENRQATQAILNYPAESIGRLMTPDFVQLRPEWTIAHAMEHIRRYGRDAETVHWVYVVDDKGTLIDDLHIRLLLLADPAESVQSIMDDRYLALEATGDREEAVRVMGRYDRTALPVVDTRGHLIGIVTSDDVADVAEEEATEDIQKLGGMEALDVPYMQASFVEMLKKRGGWLCILFLGQMLTIPVIAFFEVQLQSAAVLVLFVALIIASGGNTGTQAASLLIRALALQEISRGDWRRVFAKEMLTGLCLGSVLGILGFCSVLFWNNVGIAETTHPVHVGFVVGTAIVGIVLWAVMLGSMFPLILHRLGLDPATISSPLVATLMDVSGLIIYFVIAYIVLRGVIL